MPYVDPAAVRVLWDRLRGHDAVIPLTPGGLEPLHAFYARRVLSAAARELEGKGRMAGLRGELRELRLAHSGILVRYPAQRTFHVDGTPRESVRPDVFVDLAAPQGGPGDPILYQALKLLEK